MADFTTLEKGVKSNLISYRVGGDPVDRALSLIYRETRIPVREIIRTSIVEYGKKYEQDKKFLKKQRRNG